MANLLSLCDRYCYLGISCIVLLILSYFLLCSYILLPASILTVYVCTHKLSNILKTKAITQKLNSFISYSFPI